MEKYKLANYRQNTNHTFIWMFWYLLLTAVITGIAQLFKPAVNDGTAMLIAVIISVIIVYLSNFKRWPFELSNHSEDKKKMTLPKFLILICLVFTCQLLTVGIMKLYTLTGLPVADLGGELLKDTSLSLIIYASFIGPIVEELIFRGFLLGTLKKNGKICAIIISAICFGIMHGNPTQFFVGVLTGILLGYVFVEYSIIWTIILHIFNNFLLNELPLILFRDAALDGTVDLIILIAAIPLTIIAIVYIVKKKIFSSYINNNKNHSEKGAIKQTLSSVWIWIYLALNIAITVVTIVKSPK